MFKEVPRSFLADIATDSDRIPRIYYDGNPVMRYVFWMRLRMLAKRLITFAPRHDNCLDFGGGGGVFAPTLSELFRSVVSIDLEVAEAQQVIEHFMIENVKLLQANINSADIVESPFDAIVAADVLEHFPELEIPASRLYEWLADDGILVTSLPTENWVYILLRLLFGVEKPADHYHTGYEVEKCLSTHGFRRIHRSYVPLRFRIAPLYLISVWRKVG